MIRHYLALKISFGLRTDSHELLTLTNHATVTDPTI